MAVFQDIVAASRDTFSVSRVFGDPIEKGDVTVIPVAFVSGGGGGGSAPAEDKPDAESAGGGFGGMARPAGVYVIKADSVDWQPALDVTLLGLAGIVLTALMTVTIGSVLKRRR